MRRAAHEEAVAKGKRLRLGYIDSHNTETSLSDMLHLWHHYLLTVLHHDLQELDNHF